jgi:hypothetical protein
LPEPLSPLSTRSSQPSVGRRFEQNGFHSQEDDGLVLAS